MVAIFVFFDMPPGPFAGFPRYNYRGKTWMLQAAGGEYSSPAAY
jgi:hypothetical protein